MIKNKVWQMLVFSSIMIVLIVTGSIYTSGFKGNIVENNSLTVEGKLGGGILAVLMLVWLWTFAIFYPTFKLWRNKSAFLTSILISIFLIPVFSFIGGIYYLISKYHLQEKVKVLERKVVSDE